MIDAKREAALAAAEARLGVRFPDEYRAFIREPKQHEVMVKRVAFHAVARCAWLDDTQTAVVIGRSWTDGDERLVFKVKRGVAGAAVFRWDGTRFARVPSFGELVGREVERPPLDGDPRTRLAQRLGGAARQCTCGREVRLLQVCACGRIGAPTDAPFLLAAADLEAAARAFPDVVRAWKLVTALKASGHAVPGGPTQLLAVADLLAAAAPPRAILASWKRTRMTIAVTVAELTRVLATA